jgi:hypothetical protein
MSCSDKKYFGNMIPLTGGPTGQKDVVLVAGVGIKIEDQSDVNQYKFKFSTKTVIDLTADLLLVAKSAGNVKTSPILKGTVIDRFELSWSYNKTVVSQTLTNTAGLTPPTLVPADITALYTGQNITSNMSFTLQGNDGESQPGSIASDTESITFGNYMWIGAGASKINTSTSALEAFLEALTGQIKTSRAHTYYATGGANQKHFVAYPAAWGLATFFKSPFYGGYLRLKNVAGTLKSVLGIGDVETSILITNSAGYQEAYYVYESEYDNQADAVTPFIIS